ncbi:unnamed protein product, partial [marine sediment metagenome]
MNVDETIFEEARKTKVFDSVDVLVCGGGLVRNIRGTRF